MGLTPFQSVAGVEAGVQAGADGAIPAALLEELWVASGAEIFGIGCGGFGEILLALGTAQNFGHPDGCAPSAAQRAEFLRGVRLADVALARGCARGSERAWERFLEVYHQPLTRAAIAICGHETLGRELADALYAELYGLTERDGERRCPLDSYQGRGSLLGWLRTILAQRHVDRHRRSHREQSMEDSGLEPCAPLTEPRPAEGELAVLSQAVGMALDGLEAEERFLLAAYYLDGRTLMEIARVTRVHEATVSRKLRRLAGDLRKQVLLNLQKQGRSRRAAEEALRADPRDLDVSLKKLLQYSQLHAFPEKGVR